MRDKRNGGDKGDTGDRGVTRNRINRGNLGNKGHRRCWRYGIWGQESMYQTVEIGKRGVTEERQER